MRARHVVAAAAIAGSAGLAAHHLSTTRHVPMPASVTDRQPACGVERWDVKTLTDLDASKVDLETVTPARIGDLGLYPFRGPIEGHEPRGASPAEYSIFTVEGIVRVAKLEADSDIHLGLEDGVHTMVVEVVDPACAADSPILAEIQEARKVVESVASIPSRPGSLKAFLGLRVRATGVGFFDKLHGQSGVAPNGMELHPVRRLEILDGQDD